MRRGVALQVAVLRSQDADELLTDVVGLLEGAEVQVALPAPFLVHPLLLECVEDIDHGDMVTVGVCELGLLSVSDLGLVSGSDEDAWHVEAGHDREGLVHAVVIPGSGEENLGVQWVDGQLAHNLSNICQLTLIVKSTKVVELLQSPH